MHMQVPRVEYEKLTSERLGEPSEVIRERVQAARDRQAERFRGVDNGLTCNADMGPREVRQICVLDGEGETLIRSALRQMHLSARAYHRILKLARTIADVEGVEKIKVHHVAEALQYRAMHDAP
jgi:magnesium chelatase family protein